MKTFSKNFEIFSDESFGSFEFVKEAEKVAIFIVFRLYFGKSRKGRKTESVETRKLKDSKRTRRRKEEKSPKNVGKRFPLTNPNKNRKK